MYELRNTWNNCAEVFIGTLSKPLGLFSLTKSHASDMMDKD